jgi:hypothetical protein
MEGSEEGRRLYKSGAISIIEMCRNSRCVLLSDGWLGLGEISEEPNHL